ncbi:MAG: hypothetical protein GY696_14080 [Gammaproteobacteria bacterium]|nr:hypothetical protein [Gammaproteobacteria bacterium]
MRYPAQDFLGYTLQPHFWHPGLNEDIRNRIKSCVVCIQKDIGASQAQMDFLDKLYTLIWYKFSKVMKATTTSCPWRMGLVDS